MAIIGAVTARDGLLSSPFPPSPTWGRRDCQGNLTVWRRWQLSRDLVVVCWGLASHLMSALDRWADGSSRVSLLLAGDSVRRWHAAHAHPSAH